MKTIDTDRHYIVSDNGLAEAAMTWHNSSVLGIDTEFIRVDTFFPSPALIQVSDGRQCWLIDVLTIRDFSPLADVLTAASIMKVVHAANEDLEVFDRLLGVLPSPLFDTQIAAALCGYGASIGYSRLVQAILDVELSKDQCRSDWLARPLTSEQHHYACLDVLYLPALYQHLSQTLATQQRTHWADEENRRQLARYREQRDASYSMERINNAWRLGSEERKRLWHLILGRDAIARQHNRSRNHIAKDFALFDMARRPPSHLSMLSGIDGLRPSAIRQFGAQLLDMAQNVPTGLVCPPLSEPLTKAENDYVKNLRAVVAHIATHLQVPPDMLVRKLEMEQMVRQYLKKRDASSVAMPARFEGWRSTVIGAALHDEMKRWG